MSPKAKREGPARDLNWGAVSGGSNVSSWTDREDSPTRRIEPGSHLKYAKKSVWGRCSLLADRFKGRHSERQTEWLGGGGGGGAKEAAS